MTEDPTSAGTGTRGIFDGFEGYRTPTQTEYAGVLKNGLVAVDANVLLDLYRYNASGRADLLSALRALGNRLWVPHQAMKEFWRNRESLLKDPGGTAGLIDDLSKMKTQIADKLRNWSTQRSLNDAAKDSLLELLDSTFSQLQKAVDEGSEQDLSSWAANTEEDRVLSALSVILAGRVGPGLGAEEYAEALKEAARRIEHSIPPGYRDRGKGDDASGDYLVWVQFLTEARRRGVDALFVTRDMKEDWVRRESGQSRGPRTELVDEFRAETEGNFYLRTPGQLLALAKDVLNVNVSDLSVLDAERLSQALAKDEQKAAKDDRWWMDSERWDLPAADAFLNLLETRSEQAFVVFMQAVDESGRIEPETVMRSGVDYNTRFFKEFERAVAETVNELGALGYLPAKAPALMTPIRKRMHGEAVRLIGFQIAEEQLPLFKAVAIDKIF